MPVPSKYFYSTHDDKSETSESRWPAHSRFQSDKEVPPSDISEPLSAPASGFSAAKTTSSGLRASFLTSKQKVPVTRFARAVVKQQDRWQNICTSAQEVLSSAVNPTIKKKHSVVIPKTLPLDTLNTTDKCAEWVQSISGSKPETVKNVPLVKLVQYSPCSTSSRDAPSSINLSPYQLLRLKNVAENEASLKHLLQGSFSGMKKRSTDFPNRNSKKPRKSVDPREMPQRSSRKVARQLIQDHLSSSEDDESTEINSISSGHWNELEEDSDSSHQQSNIHRTSFNVQEEHISRDENEEVNDNVNIMPPKVSCKAAKAERHKLRNLGKAYSTTKNMPVVARSRKPPHQCKVRCCHEVITPEIGDTIFEEYWQQGSFNKRVSYVAARFETNAVQRRRSREDNPDREKSQSLKYYFDIDGKRIQVCRSTFIGTLGETDRFVRGVTENKKKSVSGITTDDRRGKHIPKHALDNNRRGEVQKHIDSFPAYLSHYCRAKTQLLYLASDLNVSKMFNLYRQEAHSHPVSYNSYLKEFNKTKKKFHPPKTDGCDTCDKADIAIEGALNEEIKKSLEAEKEKHLRKAEKAYQLKRSAKSTAMKSNGSELVLVMDLQQCLPTPYLKCKKIYYSRQLYVFNFTIHDTVTGVTHCYMWDEVEGKRGSNEIASCLLKHIQENVPDGVKKLTIFSDCCSGQNRNHVMCMMLFAALQEHPSLQRIEHIFLIPGHTFMPEVDSKHAVIETYKRRWLKRVDVPEGWYAAVEAAGKKGDDASRFQVIRMTEFFDFAALAKDLLIKRDKCLDKEPFKYMETQWFRYDKDSLGIALVRSSYAEDSLFQSLSFLRKGIRSDRVPRLLPHLATIHGPIPISSKKKKDLIELLPYLSNEHHSFYQNLPDSNDVLDVCPDIVVSNRGRSSRNEACVTECCNQDNAENDVEDFN